MVNQVLVLGQNWSERRLNREDVRGLCALVLGVYLVLLGISFVSAARNQGQTAFGTVLGADFPAFYVAGQIINEYGAARLYDRDLQAALYHGLFPFEEETARLPYLNAPFFVMPFPWLARLPYTWAFLVWFSLSLGLYVAGFTLLWRALEDLPREAYRTGLLVALSFMPFLVECLASGQTSAFGFFSLALALALKRRGRHFASGLALALLLYKPTLLVLIGPMLLVMRHWRTLAGAAAGGAGLLLMGAAVWGKAVTFDWFQTLTGYARHSTGTGASLRLWKYVDVNAFARMLTDSQGALRWVLVCVVLAACLHLLIKAWWSRRDAAELNWALAIVWTPVLNLYFGVYDLTLVVAGAMLLTAWHYRQDGGLNSQYKFLLLMLYVTPWFSQTLAKIVGLQLLTLALAVFGWHALQCARRFTPVSSAK